MGISFYEIIFTRKALLLSNLVKALLGFAFLFNICRKSSFQMLAVLSGAFNLDSLNRSNNLLVATSWNQKFGGRIT
jgi:hypothetical protein